MRYRLPNVHRYPTVEYIPITPKILAEKPAWPNLNYGNFSLIIRDGKLGWGNASEGLPREMQKVLGTLGADEAGLITLNFVALELMYRGSTVYIAAEERLDHVGLYVITKRFFYKPNLIFEAYNLKEKKLAWSSLQV